VVVLVIVRMLFGWLRCAIKPGGAGGLPPLSSPLHLLNFSMVLEWILGLSTNDVKRQETSINKGIGKGDLGMIQSRV